MYDGYNRIFWGIFITRFSINLGPVKILPAFVGYLLIVSGLDVLYEESLMDSYKKVKSLAMLIVGLSLIGLVIDFFSHGLGGSYFLSTSWTIGFMILEFLLYFKVIEASIDYLRDHDFEDLEEEYIIKLRKFTVFSMVNILLLGFSMIFNFNLLLKVFLYLSLLISVYLMTLVYGLRNIFPNPDSGDLEENHEGDVEENIEYKIEDEDRNEDHIEIDRLEK